MIFIVYIIIFIIIFVCMCGSAGVLFLVTMISGSVFAYTINRLAKAISERNDRQKKAEQEIDRNRFIAIVSALIAKVAKADGVVAASEINVAEACFKRLGVIGSPAKDFCINVFRMAKDDPLSIYDYADLLVESTKNASTRELVYEILWDMAAADGVLAAEEDAILKRLADRLQLPSELYFRFRVEKFRQHNSQSSSRSQNNSRNSNTQNSSVPRDIKIALEKLGCNETDTVEDLKRKYRQLAMRYHPDHLKQDGVPDFMIKKMHERMAEINAAWERICKFKGIH